MNLLDPYTLKGTAVAVCAAILATVVATFVIPPGVSSGDTGTHDPGGLAGDLPTVLPEDLSAFVGSGRWGISLEAVLETVAAEQQARRGLNPELRRMGFLGLIETGDATAVLLASPEPDGGGIIQLSPGDTLPDGRVLSSVTDNSITLNRNLGDAGGTAVPVDGNGPLPDTTGVHQEVLLLFPRGKSVPATGQDS